mmetsp:Transcript_126377/g.269582  ORF Transcript_126377/g.269582 Transcript_126377/m.269582 type:complete len:151 (-) Transcript_126377:52-504(-)
MPESEEEKNAKAREEAKKKAEEDALKKMQAAKEAKERQKKAKEDKEKKEKEKAEADAKAQAEGKKKSTQNAGEVWLVVGGGEKGGIVVRSKEDIKSEEVGRIATGATIEEIEMKGNRLHYKKVSGKGPDDGWVSTKFKDADLLSKVGGGG